MATDKGLEDVPEGEFGFLFCAFDTRSIPRRLLPARRHYGDGDGDGDGF